MKKITICILLQVGLMNFGFAQTPGRNNFKNSLFYLNGIVEEIEKKGYDVKSIRIGKGDDIGMSIEFNNSAIDTLFVEGIGIKKDFKGTYSQGELNLFKVSRQYNSSTKIESYFDSTLVSQKKANSVSIENGKDINIWELFFLPNAGKRYSPYIYQIKFDVLEDTNIGTVSNSITKVKPIPNSYDTFVVILYTKNKGL